MSQAYRDLIVWQKAVELVTEIYRVTRQFPKDEIYGLSSQIRRAAVSVPCNIAEGQGRLTRREFHQFLGYARGSLMEMETQVVIAGNLGDLQEDQVSRLLELSAEVGRILNGLLGSISK
jgi:four helix bundle protein